MIVLMAVETGEWIREFPTPYYCVIVVWCNHFVFRALQDMSRGTVVSDHVVIPVQ